MYQYCSQCRHTVGKKGKAVENKAQGSEGMQNGLQSAKMVRVGAVEGTIWQVARAGFPPFGLPQCRGGDPIFGFDDASGFAGDEEEVVADPAGRENSRTATPRQRCGRIRRAIGGPSRRLRVAARFVFGRVVRVWHDVGRVAGLVWDAKCGCVLWVGCVVGGVWGRMAGRGLVGVRGALTHKGKGRGCWCAGDLIDKVDKVDEGADATPLCGVLCSLCLCWLALARWP